eukprot:7136977-Pyramimonas_sp.AAC.3
MPLLPAHVRMVRFAECSPMPLASRGERPAALRARRMAATHSSGSAAPGVAAAERRCGEGTANSASSARPSALRSDA